MKRTLYIETSTTGNWQFRSPTNADVQPHMTRLCWLAVDDERQRDWCKLIRPNRAWRFEASQVVATGINREWCETEGIPLMDAMQPLLEELQSTEQLVAFNLDFHWRVLDRSAWECHLQLPVPPFAHCAMRRSVPLIKKLRRNAGGWAYPKRSEAYEHFTSKHLPRFQGEPVGYALEMIHTLDEIWRGIEAAEAKKEQSHE